MNTQLSKVSDSTLDALVEFRRHLHAHPELSGKEEETAKLITGYLVNCAPTYILESIGGTGVMATFDSGQPGPALLFRAELDALPIQEINSFPYRSTIEGIAHKCGHDGHATILLGLARLIADNPISKGKVTLLFQPAEETGEGAAAILKDPQFAPLHFDFAFALHNLPGYPKHQIIIRQGAFNATVKSLILKLHGKTAHAAEPENGINPAFAIAEILQFIQNLSQPNTHQPDFCLLTPVHISLGEKAYGTSAGYGELHLTLRSWTSPEMEKLTTHLFQHLQHIQSKYQLKIEHNWLQAFESNTNAPEAVQLISTAAEALSLDVHQPPTPFKWGEDFGLFTQQFKGALFGLGAGVDHPNLHNPDYDFPDEIIPTGIHIFYSIIRQLSF